MKYHITSKGKPGPCFANENPCPLGGEHFESEAKAYESLAKDHPVLPEPVQAEKKTGEDLISEFQSGGSATIADLLGTIEPDFLEKKRAAAKAEAEERREKEKAAAKPTMLTPIEVKQELLRKTQELNDERRTLVGHAARIERDKQVRELLAVLKSGDTERMREELKKLGDDEDTDASSKTSKPVTPPGNPVTTAKPVSPEAAKRLAELEGEISSEQQAKIDSGELVRHPSWGLIPKAQLEWMEEQKAAEVEAEKVFGPEPDSFGKVFGDAVKAASKKLEEATSKPRVNTDEIANKVLVGLLKQASGRRS